VEEVLWGGGLRGRPEPSGDGGEPPGGGDLRRAYEAGGGEVTARGM